VRGERYAHNAKERGTIATAPEGVNERATRACAAFHATRIALVQRPRHASEPLQARLRAAVARAPSDAAARVRARVSS
jgi:hypothetical protein